MPELNCSTNLTMANRNLTSAKNAKNDEFYTQYHDIEKEMSAYLEFNPNVFRDKTILLPCDDPEWSNFTKYFAQNFERFGLKKLISTSFAPDSKKFKTDYQPTLFEVNDPQYDEEKTRTKGKIFTLTRDMSGDGRINVNDLEWHYLQGDGDFRSNEITNLRDECDIVVTNPPFSLFRSFLDWLIDANKQFVIIGNKSCVTYKEVFPLIMHNKIWSGKTHWSGGMWFETKNTGDIDKVINGIPMKNVPSVWFSNIEHGRRHMPLKLMTMNDNIRFNKKLIKSVGFYQKYDNYDAIEVPYTDAIPNDYSGIMGVPISFLDKYSPNQFEIVGLTKTWFGLASKIYPPQVQVNSNGEEKEVTKLNDGATLKMDYTPKNQTYYLVSNEVYIQLYARVLIKHKIVI